MRSFLSQTLSMRSNDRFLKRYAVYTVNISFSQMGRFPYAFYHFGDTVTAGNTVLLF